MGLLYNQFILASKVVSCMTQCLNPLFLEKLESFDGRCGLSAGQWPQGMVEFSEHDFFDASYKKRNQLLRDSLPALRQSRQSALAALFPSRRRLRHNRGLLSAPVLSTSLSNSSVLPVSSIKFDSTVFTSLLKSGFMDTKASFQITGQTAFQLLSISHVDALPSVPIFSTLLAGNADHMENLSQLVYVYVLWISMLFRSSFYVLHALSLFNPKNRSIAAVLWVTTCLQSTMALSTAWDDSFF